MDNCGCDHPDSSDGMAFNKKCGLVIVLAFLLVLAFIIFVPGPWNGTEHLRNANLGGKLSAAGWILYSRGKTIWTTPIVGTACYT